LATRFTCDFHVHSRYTRGASADMTLEQMAAHAKLKGLWLLGTGDFMHPAWFLELKEMLRPAELEGLYEYKGTLFLLTAEVSSFFSQKGRGRKVHSLVFAPSLEVALRIRQRLRRYGSLSLDGVPALSISTHDLLKLLKDLSPEAFLVPSHIWNPLNSLFGARAGFNSLEECFGEDTEEVFALETGLASDPPMSWRQSSLNGKTLISGSDARDPCSLGRKAFLLATPLPFAGIRQAICSRDPEKVLGTLESFPKAGRYYHDGHRGCRVCLSPEEAEALQNLCPVCGRHLSMGVLHRVEELADRPPGEIPPGALPFTRLLPLREILSQVLRMQAETSLVESEYMRLVQAFGNELNVLLDVPLSYLEKVTSPACVQAIAIVRSGRLNQVPGCDGRAGQVVIPRERQEMPRQIPVQISLF
jgi:uncharacterized protein (TIGR00375 family)